MHPKHKIPFTFSASQIFRHNISDLHRKRHSELLVAVIQGHEGVTTVELVSSF